MHISLHISVSLLSWRPMRKSNVHRPLYKHLFVHYAFDVRVPIGPRVRFVYIMSWRGAIAICCAGESADCVCVMVDNEWRVAWPPPSGYHLAIMWLCGYVEVWLLVWRTVYSRMNAGLVPRWRFMALVRVIVVANNSITRG